MQQDPENRFQTSDDLLASLEEAHRDITREIPDAVVRDYVRGKDYTMSINRDLLKVQKPGLLNKLPFFR